MKNTNPTPLRSASLVKNGYHIDVMFDDNGKLDDIAIFNEDHEVIYSESAKKTEELLELLDFTLGYNYPKGDK